MKYVHINHINGLLVEFNKQPLLIQIDANEDGNLVFQFKDPLTDVELLTDDEARALLLALMEDSDEQK